MKSSLHPRPAFPPLLTAPDPATVSQHVSQPLLAEAQLAIFEPVTPGQSMPDPSAPGQSMPTQAIASTVVALVASAGGLHALEYILARLPASFPAAVVVVQHLAPNYPSHLVDILSRHTQLKIEPAQQDRVLEPGTVYVAPPNHHLLVTPSGTLTLTQTERIHFVRPAADLLLASLAHSYSDRAFAVVLTGTGCDGAAGICDIKAHGGTTLAEDIESAEFAGMPTAAINTGKVDFVLPLANIASQLISLVGEGNAS